MRIGVDAHPAAKIESALMPTPIQVQAPRIGVDLQDSVFSEKNQEVASWSVNQFLENMFELRHLVGLWQNGCQSASRWA
jgi:hypothetical protein